MAIEKIQYVHDHIRFHMRVLRPVINQFFYAVAKRTTNNNKKMREKAIEAVRQYLVPQNLFN